MSLEAGHVLLLQGGQKPAEINLCNSQHSGFRALDQFLRQVCLDPKGNSEHSEVALETDAWQLAAVGSCWAPRAEAMIVMKS